MTTKYVTCVGSCMLCDVAILAAKVIKPYTIIFIHL